MNYRLFVNYTHVLIVMPLLIYVGLLKKNTPEYLYTVLLILGVVGMLYHSYKLYKRYTN